MAKLSFYSATNNGRFQDDSEDGSPNLYFERLKDAKAFAVEMLGHWDDEREYFEIRHHESNTYGDNRQAVVAALNRELCTQSVVVGCVHWNPGRGAHFIKQTRNQQRAGVSRKTPGTYAYAPSDGG